MEHKQNMPYFDEFVRYKILYEDISQNTIKNYEIHLRTFYEFTGGKININKVTIENYIEHRLKVVKEARSTVQARLMALKSYFKYLFDENIIDRDVSKYIKGIKLDPQKAKKIPDEEEIFKKLEAIDDVRDRALMETLYATGVREEELSNLNIEDIDFKNKLIVVNRGKRKKSRIIPINDEALKWIKAYIGVRKQGPLFLNNRRTRLGTRSIYSICKSYFDMPPHDLRHIFATHMLANTNNPEAVKEMLGHTDVRFTMKQYTHLASNHLSKIYKGGMKR